MISLLHVLTNQQLLPSKQLLLMYCVFKMYRVCTSVTYHQGKNYDNIKIWVSRTGTLEYTVTDTTTLDQWQYVENIINKFKRMLVVVLRLLRLL
jgi:hypothetical protein